MDLNTPNNDNEKALPSLEDLTKLDLPGTPPQKPEITLPKLEPEVEFPKIPQSVERAQNEILGGTPGYAPYQPMVATTNAAAIISMVSGVLSILFVLPVIGSIVAIIAGVLARKEIRLSNGTQTGDGMAITGIVLGGISLALVCIGMMCAGLLFVGALASGG